MKKLRDLRNLHEKSKEEICEYLGINVNTYRNYEKEGIIPNVVILSKLADYYNTTVDALIDRVPKEEVDNQNFILKQNINKLLTILNNDNLKRLQDYINGLLEHNTK